MSCLRPAAVWAGVTVALCTVPCSATAAQLGGGLAESHGVSLPSSAEGAEGAEGEDARRPSAPQRKLASNPDHLSFAIAKKWDCETKHVNWGRWPLERKAWCCQHRGEACPPGAQEPYDCNADRADWKNKWSVEKQSWCCKVRGVACSSEIYDCENGFTDFWKGASLEKMDYCCKYSDYPCPHTSEPLYTSTLTTTVTTTTVTTVTTTITTTTVTATTVTSTSTVTSTTKTETTVTTTPTTTTVTTTTVTSTTTTSTSVTSTTVTSTVTSTSTQTTTVTTSTTTATTLNPVDATLECAEEGVDYVPLDMPGTSLKTVDSIADCQDLCKSTAGCAHFTFYVSLQNCHLHDANAKPVPSSGFISGPPSCEETSIIEEYSLSAPVVKSRHVGLRFIMWTGSAFALMWCAFITCGTRRHGPLRRGSLVPRRDEDVEEQRLLPQPPVTQRAISTLLGVGREAPAPGQHELPSNLSVEVQEDLGQRT